VDGYTHQTDPDSPLVHRAVVKVDATVGRLRARLRERGDLDESLILLVSDHGATSVHTHLDLADWFRAKGVKTLSHPVIWERNPLAAVMVAGNGSAMVYARPDEPRRDRWPIERLRQPETFGARVDVVAALLKEPAVALVAAESQVGGIWVASREGAGRIWADGDTITYQPGSGDPLQMGRAWSATSRDWLEATWDRPFPDAPFHLLDQFRSPRTGDLLVIAREGYDFRRRFEVPEHKAGHGSLIRAHMQTPVWSSQPIPPAAIRTVDLFPSMLSWLGVPSPANIDGVAIWHPGVPAAVATGSVSVLQSANA
jgi:hypothetical protein